MVGGTVGVLDCERVTEVAADVLAIGWEEESRCCGDWRDAAAEVLAAV